LALIALNFDGWVRTCGCPYNEISEDDDGEGNRNGDESLSKDHIHRFTFALSPISTSRRIASERRTLLSEAQSSTALSVFGSSRADTKVRAPVGGLPGPRRSRVIVDRFIFFVYDNYVCLASVTHIR
jgi:hypothetical protein